MTETNHLAQANIEFLKQGIDLLDLISDELFLKTRDPVYTSCIGGHLRHSLDHAAIFARDWSSGQVDYDDRIRGTQVEKDRREARNEMNRLIPLFQNISDKDMIKALRVKMDCGGMDLDEVNWADTSVMRELQFLVSHTVHHYALISMILKLEGVTPDSGFGYAPATIKYLKSLG